MKKNLIALAIVVSLSGCSGIMSGGEDTVTINAGSSNAEIYVDGIYQGKDRIRIDLKRGRDYELKTQQDGCKDAYVVTESSLDNWFWANILIDWGIISMPIDLISGNAFGIDKSQYDLIVRCEEKILANVK